MKKSYILAFTLFLSYFCNAQQEIPNESRPKLIEMKLGFGKLQPQLSALDMNFFVPVYGVFSATSFTQLCFSAWNRNPNNFALVINQFHALQSVGVGASVGRKINFGSYYLIGGHYYHSRTVAKDLYNSELITNKINLETGLLFKLKVGRKRYYFSSQLYFPLTPQSRTLLEKNPTITIGLGRRLLK